MSSSALNSSPVFEARELCFRYPGAKVDTLHALTFSISEGERVALLGENGAGKSTLLLHFNGIHRPSSGSMHVFGQEPSPRNLGEIRRRVGMVFQNPDDQLFATTLGEDVAYGPRGMGLAKDVVAERVGRSLERVGLASVPLDHSPARLSIGQKKRAAIAGVLAMEPDFLVLDEPFSSLDPRGRREFSDLLSGLGGTQIIISHDLEAVEKLCNRFLVMHEGRLVRDGGLELLRDLDFLADVGLA